MATKCRVMESGICSITQPYHINGQRGYDYDHWGIDLTDFNGSYNVLGWEVAHSDGYVVDTRNDCTGFEYNSYGNYVLLEHANGFRTMYAHMSYGTVQVVVGQKVKKGQRLGYMGNTGTSYGGHLHFEMRTSLGYQFDPEPYLNADLPSGWVTWLNGGWFYVRNGAVDYSYTGVAPNENGWWYVKNGKVDFSYTGIAQNEYGWWRIENGKVNFKFTGLAQNENGWWYLKDGKVDFSYNGIVQNSAGWWVVVNGKVDFTYNGLANNEHGWFMIQKGKVNFDYNGLAMNKNGTWVLKEGKVDFDFSGDYVFSGSTWNVSKGKVQ